MSIRLPADFERAVLERVRSGPYASAEEVLTAMMEALVDAEADESAEAPRLPRAESRKAEPDEASPGLSVSIPGGWADFVEDQVVRGRFGSPEMVVEAALLRLQGEFEDEALTDEEREELRREIQLGIESAENEPLIPGDEVVARMLTWLCDPAAREFVGQKIEAGEYESVAEVLSVAIHILMEAEEMDRDPEALRRELQIGRDSLARGEGVPGDQARQMMMGWREGEDAA